MTEQIRRRSAPQQIAQQITQRKIEEVIDRCDFIDSGCTILNLAASQKGRDGGWPRGRIINIVGDGSSGKTLLALEACAQAYYRLQQVDSKVWPKPKKVNIVYNNVESVMDMPIDVMYGRDFVDAVEWIPDGNELREEPMTVEAFGRDLFFRIAALPEGEALIYVLDSLDSLTTEKGIDRMDKSVKSGKALDGSYGSGVERAKYLSSEFFGPLCSMMAGKDVTIFLISQVREKLDAMLFGEKHYRAGGKALDFYTHCVVWLAQVKKLTKEFKDEKRVYGVRVKARFKRNKVSIPFREAEFDILFGFGIDNLGSCAEFLTFEEIGAIHGGKRLSRTDFIDLVDHDLVMKEKLIDAVESKWRLIEEKTKVSRCDRWGCK